MQRAVLHSGIPQINLRQQRLKFICCLPVLYVNRSVSQQIAFFGSHIALAGRVSADDVVDALPLPAFQRMEMAGNHVYIHIRIGFFISAHNAFKLRAFFRCHIVLCIKVVFRYDVIDHIYIRQRIGFQHFLQIAVLGGIAGRHTLVERGVQHDNPRLSIVKSISRRSEILVEQIQVHIAALMVSGRDQIGLSSSLYPFFAFLKFRRIDAVHNVAQLDHQLAVL